LTLSTRSATIVRMSDRDGGWLSRLFRRTAPRRDFDARHVREIIEAYSACLERRASERPHRPERELPYSKETIGRALLMALKFAKTPQVAEPLRYGFVELERFLPENEWTVVDEYERLAAVGGLGGGMTNERRAAAVQLLADIEARRGRRFELLSILERERDTAR
jgi:hypothetical protein